MRKFISFFILFLFVIGTNSSYAQWVTQTFTGTSNLTSVNFLNTTTGLAVGSGGTIIKTTNGGTTWAARTSLTANNLASVVWMSATSALAVGQFGIILMSTNSGDNWTNQTTGTNLNGVFCVNGTTAYACGNTGTMLKTTNSGVNWTTQTTGTTNNLMSVYFVSEGFGYACGTAGRIITTTNGGTNWTILTSGTTNNLNSVYAAGGTVYVCGAAGTMRVSTNAGTNWTGQSLGTTTNTTCVRFTPPVPATGWATGSSGRINFTNNGGINWSQQTSPSTNNLNSVHMVTNTTGWIVGDGSTILKTTTGGLSVPAAPTLTTPANGASNVSLTPTFGWNNVAGASSYLIQISTVSNFAIITDSSTRTVNSYTPGTGILQPATGYFWRVRASNSMGNSPFSSTFNFSTSLNPPPVPTLLTPANGSGAQSLTPTLTWQSLPSIIRYRVEVSTISSFGIITDSATIPGGTTQYIIPAGKLQLGLTYFWRVNAANASGTGAWSSPFNFSTVLTGINLVSSEVPKEFKLNNNYPNPFNPSTKIRFSVPKSEFVSLKVYSIDGKLVDELLKTNLTAGTFEVEWNADNFASGVYFYRLESSSFIDTKRMLLVK